MRAKRIVKWIGGTLAVVVVLVALLFVHVWYFRPLSINIFFERVLLQFTVAEPELLSTLGILRQVGYRGLDDELGDASPEHTEDMARLVRKDLEQLRRYDRASLSTSQQLSYDALEWFLADLVEGERWQYHDYPVNQLFGVQSDTPDFMLRVHLVEDATDARNYNKRLVAFSEKFAGLLKSLRLRETKGVMPPKFVIRHVLDQMGAFIAPPAQQNVLYTSFDEKLGKARSISTQERAKFLDGARTAIDSNVYPAYRELIAYFEHLEQTVKEEEYGAWRLPEGDAFYDYLVRHHTTTNLSAQAVHELGLAEVARIEAEMDALLKSQGLTEGTIGARFAQLSAEPRMFYSNDDAGREQCLTEYRRIMDEITQALPKYFTGVPKLNVRVERVPKFKEATTAGAYADSGSLDGSRPGTFYVTLRDMREQPKYGMRTLTYHEGVPGHLLQGAYALQLTDVPTFRKVLPFTAYNEGWGLYAERLAWEMGFEQDPLDNLGRLQLEMLRAARLVVDTGIHRKHWTREQSIDYIVEKTGRARSDTTSEVERYFVQPGQALAYKVGMQKILELRSRAQQQLGNKFDIRDFHRVVLSNGGLPLDMLEAQVKGWLDYFGS